MASGVDLGHHAPKVWDHPTDQTVGMDDDDRGDDVDIDTDSD